MLAADGRSEIQIDCRTGGYDGEWLCLVSSLKTFVFLTTERMAICISDGIIYQGRGDLTVMIVMMNVI